MAVRCETGGFGTARSLFRVRVVLQGGYSHEAGMNGPSAGGLREVGEAGPLGGGGAGQPVPVCAELGGEVATGEQVRAGVAALPALLRSLSGPHAAPNLEIPTHEQLNSPTT